jgi:hypothetical protein
MARLGALKEVFNTSNLLLLLGALYYFHWYDVSISSIERFSTTILFLILAISAIYAVYAVFHYKMPRVFLIIALMLFMFLVYGIISMLTYEDIVIAFSGTTIKKATYMVAVFRSFLPVFAFYVFSRRGLVTEKSMLYWTVIFFLTSFLVYYFSRQYFIRNDDTADLTYNVGYLFVALIPFCFLFKRPLFKYSFLLVNMVCLFLCMKRGAIVCGLLSAAMVVYKDFESVERGKFFRVLVLIIFIVAGAYLLKDYYLSSSYFQRRLEATLQGNSSGRGGLIDGFRHYFFYETSLFQILLGSGADATLRIGQNYAHNDWWELLIDQGLLGFTIYLLFWIQMFKSLQRTKHDSTTYSLFSCCFAVLFLKTFISMSYSMIPIPTAMCLGYCLAQDRPYVSSVNSV